MAATTPATRAIWDEARPAELALPGIVVGVVDEEARVVVPWALLVDAGWEVVPEVTEVMVELWPEMVVLTDAVVLWEEVVVVVMEAAEVAVEAVEWLVVELTADEPDVVGMDPVPW